ncbi:hypothetical protein [Helicobacter heilmannii]|uniref:hypothetical protein n=1 Tax=Helicobacter heilmannii TaxID=35817 RepID=UPI0006A06280|nr:hypothetical protein [Helicobacter heilmannii]CRF45686.1 hypothetical protein HHE014_06570 [Helicobacter heilmannii]CRF48744.1 hypothetical protein HHE03_03180 [Helicobacter heilmannii]CRF51631.1 hypothetical protein HHE06_15190 [Helicobacter heilmannii]
MRKKFIFILLGMGGLLCVVLLGVGLKLSGDVKRKLEQSLNRLAVNIHAKPFKCHGFKNIVCQSVGVAGHTGAIQVALEEVKANALRFKLDIPTIHAKQAWQPTSAHCLLDLSLKDTLIGQNACELKNLKATYEFSLSARFKEGNKPVSLKNLLGKDAPTKDLEVLVERLGFKVSSKDMRSLLYPLLQKSGDINNPHFDTHAYDKALKEIARSFKGTILVGLLVAGLQDEVAKANDLSQKFLDFANNKRDSVGFELLNKNAPFMRWTDLRNFKEIWAYLPHFSLKVLP